ncbi:hypothetical protein N0M98_29830 [Paenibacillus doosanensis]|uniref:hypothetical protein n=1 Tax=Paenibacillus doosanensis TaxID=1229154 RepID=UPI00217F4907|nr:hypothetical protein [Paenibacillus doosanensis]MCS7464307.1 hypothetical protein [Paenibacillus doosanensis]
METSISFGLISHRSVPFILPFLLCHDCTMPLFHHASNAYTNRTQSTIDIFTGDYNNLMAAEEAFVYATALAIIGIETIIAFIAAGVGAVGAAVLVQTDYNICNSDLQKAYGYINQM